MCVCACLLDLRERTLFLFISLLLSSFIYSALTLLLPLFFGRCVFKMDHHCRIITLEGGREGGRERKKKRKRDVVLYFLSLTFSTTAWMFNCIGQYNHRHFMLFIIFMWLGVCYVVHCCWTRVIAGMQLDTVSIINIIILRLL